MNNTPMTRLENMTQFLLEHGVNPKKEPINTVLFHLKAAESELAEAREHYRMSSVCRKMKEQRDELSGHYHRLNAENVILQQQRNMLAEALQAFMRWADSVDVPNEVQRMCHKALAAVKGGEL